MSIAKLFAEQLLSLVVAGMQELWQILEAEQQYASDKSINCSREVFDHNCSTHPHHNKSALHKRGKRQQG